MLPGTFEFDRYNSAAVGDKLDFPVLEGLRSPNLFLSEQKGMLKKP